MNENVLKQTEDYFDRLEAALGKRTAQHQDILAEVRADLVAQVEALQGQGRTEAEAVGQALDNLGSPEVLATEMKRALPPLSSGGIRIVRYLLAGGMVIWTLLLVWTFRAWNYGTGVGPLFAVALHLPVILLLWPNLIWRKNWLFGVVPAGIAVLFALLFVSTGTESTREISMPLEGEGVAVEVFEEPEHVIALQVWVLMGALVVLVVVLLGALQRAAQRRLVFLAVICPILIVEGMYQWEEGQFRKQRDQFATLLAASGGELAAQGRLSEAGVHGVGSAEAKYRLGDDGRDYTLYWPRPLSAGFSICYSSAEDRIWVND